MHDAQPNGVQPVLPSEAPQWNKQGFGIFWAVNTFREGVRRIDHLERIEAWAVDMDAGTKAEQWARLRGGPLVPSRVIETKRGFQAYWRAKDASSSGWNSIVLGRLVPYYGADKNARDLARILRVPGYLHMKDPKAPFLVREVHRWPVAYTEAQMLAAYPASAEERQREVHAESQREAKVEGDDFWERVFSLDCEQALLRLSGSPAVSGERYTFKRNRTGTKNIFVDGKSSSCWIDKHGRIGSLSKGGPTVFQWLRWFKHSPKECVEIIKRTFPEVEKP